MTYNSILVEDRNGIAIVTINRPQALNALNNDVFIDLIKLFDEDLPSRDGLKGVVITGAGEKAFVAGADIKEFLELPTGSEGESLTKRGHDLSLIHI